jgi:hypothetical protein
MRDALKMSKAEAAEFRKRLLTIAERERVLHAEHELLLGRIDKGTVSASELKRLDALNSELQNLATERFA